MKTYQVECQFCGHTQEWDLHEAMESNDDIESLYDALKYDQSYVCEQCGCTVYLSEALPSDVIANTGFN